MFNNVSVQAV